MKRSRTMPSWPVGTATLAVYLLTGLSASPFTHGLWATLLAVTTALLLAKCVEVLADLCWVRANARAYVLLIERLFRSNLSVNIDALDRRYGHRPFSWGLAQQHAWLVPAVEYFFRIPVLVGLNWILTLRLMWSPNVSPTDRTLLMGTAAAVGLGIMTTVISATIQRLYYGWFDFYKREWRTHPIRRYTLKLKQTSAQRVVGVQVAQLILMFYITIAGFANVYYTLTVLHPAGCPLSNVTAASSPVRFLYFSAVTMSTVGYGDIAPQGALGETLVLLQIFTGPLFLTLLVLTLGGSAAPPTRPQGRQRS